MRAQDLLVEVRRVDGNRVGALLPQHINLTAEIPLNAVGNWTLTTPMTGPLAADLMTPGAGIVVSDAQTRSVLFSGPITSIMENYTRDNPQGLLIASGATDELILQDALAWPEPDNDNADLQAVARDERTGQPSDVILGFVSDNIGPTGTDSRRVAGLVLDTPQEFLEVDDVEVSARFDNLLTLIQGTANTAKLAFRVTHQNGLASSRLVFRLVPIGGPETRTAVLRAETHMASVQIERTPPGATRVFVGGDGSSTSRAFLEYSNDDSLAAEDEWGRRIERFVAATGTTLALETAGKDSLAEDGFTKLTARFEPTEQIREAFGTEWDIGDEAIVYVGSTAYRAPINGLVLKADREGLRIGATVGEVVQTGDQIEKRLAGLETYR